MSNFTSDGDEHLAHAINAGMRQDRDLQMFLGIAKGILMDGHVDDSEAKALLAWCRSHPDVIDQWPANKVYRCLSDILQDRVVDRQERQQLTELLVNVTGERIGPQAIPAPTGLPFDRPLPSLRFQGQLFVFTGVFAFGPRNLCWQETQRMGGVARPNVTFKTDYLVIGTLTSRDWKYGAFGKKIQKAVDYRDRRAQIAIIPEDHWAADL